MGMRIIVNFILARRLIPSVPVYIDNQPGQEGYSVLPRWDQMRLLSTRKVIIVCVSPGSRGIANGREIMTRRGIRQGGIM